MKLGIDLGTTFSLAAVLNAQGVPVLVPDRQRGAELRTPSVVHVSGNDALVGLALEDLLAEDASLPIARGFKRSMGEVEPAYLDGEGRAWDAESLSALVLRKLMNDVEAFAAEEIDDCVITVPANFNDAQRRATQLAARLAGLPRVHLIEEPIAAAAFYGFSEKCAEQTLFVYDFGGGTFDATVLQISQGRLYVLATEGSNTLGGRRIDAALAAQLAHNISARYGFDPLHSLAGAEMLRSFAEDAKISLSRPGRGVLRKTLLLGGKVVDVALSPEQVKHLITPIVEETFAVSRRCLEGAGLSWNQIDALLLTGGSSLLPQVAQRLRQESGKPAEALNCRHPHQAVAYGAALVAALSSAPSEAQPLNAVAPYHLGLRVRDAATGRDRIEVMIKRNSPLPATHTATFYTTRPEQTRLVLDIVQSKGEGELVASLGHFAFGPIRRPRKNYPVDITLAYDTEGLVRVTARDLVTGDALARELAGGDSPELARFSHARGMLQRVVVNR
jgi:molecular chaperone DnaK